MDKQQAEYLGLPVHPSKHGMHKRAPWHDYHKKGLYMLTIVIKERWQILGNLLADPEPRVDLLPLGEAILRGEIHKIQGTYPMVEVWRVCIMPDHMHMIVRVSEDMPPKKHLGDVVRGFKAGCNQAYRRIFGLDGGTMFERGYNDRLLLEGDQLDRWKKYLSDNPKRLWLKRQHPDLFVTVGGLTVADRPCQIYGNRFLLDIPDKMAVVVHRADSDEVHAMHVKEWMACGERGGVLVSAAIAQRERDVMHEAMERDYCVIWLRFNGFRPMYKPSGRAFDACARGQLLEVSPFDYDYERKEPTRAICLMLNAMAEQMAGKYPP